MGACYREMFPRPRLSQYVECYWSLETTHRVPRHRVVPDGCCDIILSLKPAEVPTLTVVGLMTRPVVRNLEPGERFFGVRFKPGMASCFLAARMPELVNGIVTLSEVWGPIAETVRDQLVEQESDAGRAAAFEKVNQNKES